MKIFGKMFGKKSVGKAEPALVPDNIKAGDSLKAPATWRVDSSHMAAVTAIENACHITIPRDRLFTFSFQQLHNQMLKPETIGLGANFWQAELRLRSDAHVLYELVERPILRSKAIATGKPVAGSDLGPVHNEFRGEYYKNLAAIKERLTDMAGPLSPGLDAAFIRMEQPEKAMADLGIAISDFPSPKENGKRVEQYNNEKEKPVIRPEVLARIKQFRAREAAIRARGFNKTGFADHVREPEPPRQR